MMKHQFDSTKISIFEMLEFKKIHENNDQYFVSIFYTFSKHILFSIIFFANFVQKQIELFFFSNAIFFHICFIEFCGIDFEHKKLSLMNVNRINIDHLYYLKRMLKFSI